jgi:hypothetical protein
MDEIRLSYDYKNSKRLERKFKESFVYSSATILYAFKVSLNRPSI